MTIAAIALALIPMGGNGMTDYNDGKWHGWNGGECPVHPKSVVKFVFPDGFNGEQPAGELSWHGGYSSSIIAFRVVKEHREPREVWLQEGYITGSWIASDKYGPGAVLFREVIE